MSKQNKANKNNYSQAGRLTADELGRERAKQDSARPSNQNEAMVNRERSAANARSPKPPSKSRMR